LPAALTAAFPAALPAEARPLPLDTFRAAPGTATDPLDWIHRAAAAVAAGDAAGDFQAPAKPLSRNGMSVPTPPAHGAQFFGGEDEEFWDAVTMLATD
jgi:hypothetical protein